ncbi:ABC transporter substrate-binding protein [Sphingomonas sp.]|uniref:ABC transporter substrate-binding protein n=1 Tax=Sphingomonas sp. TaxID=28214 RepID=UPI001D21789D|nr:ABC transporter substrate-binding protein [Sphingomonas sp.]MBX9796014.1 ABC transporter substrate-binding protein [Sphingomonas sp.]
MKWAIPLPMLALALAACAPSAAAPGGGGIVSTNPCADAMLLALVPPERVAAISHYSKDPAASSIAPALAARLRATAGTAEEVIALRPDLVITSSFAPPATRAAYARAGLRTLVLDGAPSVSASVAQLRTLAAAVGAQARGEALVAAIERAAQPVPPKGIRTLLYLGGGMANGPGNLLDDMMTRAGLTNAAADYGLAYSGAVSAEALALRPPALILAPDLSARQARARAAVLGARTRQAVFPRRLINCGGPVIIEAMATLKQVAR